MSLTRPIAAILAVLVASSAPAEEVRVVTWNAGEMFDLGRVAARKDDLAAFGREVRPDVLLLQEVNSHEVVVAMAEAMGMRDAHVVCSNFNPKDDQEFSSFEVAVVSRFPIAHAVEYDQTRDNKLYDPTQPADEYPEAPLKLGVPKAFVFRGFLWARIEDPAMTVAVTHLKSSYPGDSGDDTTTREGDARNAAQREYMAGAIALSALEDARLLPNHLRLVGGDFNVGVTDVKKNGLDPLDDEADGFDDTHALLSAGLVGGLRMRSLVAEVGETYDSDEFPGTGAIDVLYVDGPGADRFRPARKAERTYGSDHFPVVATYERPAATPSDR